MNSNDPERQSPTSAPRRRQFLLAGATVGSAVLAGCTADSTDDSASDPSSDETSDQSEEQTADDEPGEDPNFRLLVSDMPADIGDFDRLDVTFDSARIFEAEDDADEESDAEGNDGGSNEADESDDGDTEAEGDDGDEDGDDEAEDEDGDDEGDSDDQGSGAVERDRGFYVLDLDGATVDLTQVVGDRAMSVFEGALAPGTYRKVELHVATIEGIVDDETAEVKVPSEKLQITKPFEVRTDDTVDFVFDINVVQRGREARYNLTPVISESGVAGEDVAVEEVDGEDDDGAGDDEDDGAGDEESNESADGGSADADDESGEDGTDEDGTGE